MKHKSPYYSFLGNYNKDMKKETSHLTSHVGFWLRRVSNQVSYSFARKVEASGVTVAEWVILRELFEIDEEVAPSIVADNTKLTRGAVSKLIERLVSKKLVDRKSSKDDGRYQTVSLTKAGKALVPKLAKLADQNDNEFFDGLTKAEKNQLLNTLKKIVESKGISEIPTE